MRETIDLPGPSNLGIDDSLNLTPPPVERRRNRTVEVFKNRGFCDRCPWWLGLLLCLLLLGALLGLFYGFKDTLFGKKSKATTEVDNGSNN
mgnify:CR=1 FL=1